MPLTIALWSVAVLLSTAFVATTICRFRVASTVVYAICLTVSLTNLMAVGPPLFGKGPPLTLWLPIGLPWIGANFRIDALAALFLVVVNLGGAAASLFALGYGRHETRAGRVLPFYPAFLAGMNLVVLADDAFMFLVSWEFMSLASWALVMAHHHEPRQRRAGYVYIMMASFGTLALLLAFGLLAGPQGDYAFRRHGRRRTPAWLPGLVLVLVLAGCWLQGGSGAAARVAAARPSGGSEPCLRADERRHDQGRDLRLRAHRFRSDGLAGMVVEHGRARRRRHHRRAGRAERHAAA